jgi:hypothetical protein
MKRFFIVGAVFVAGFLFSFGETVLGQSGNQATIEMEGGMGGASGSANFNDDEFDGIIPSKDVVITDNEKRDRSIGQAFSTGDLHLDDVFWVIIKLIDLVSKLAGSVAVLFLLYGGIQLMISGISDDKESAKNTIKYAIMGLVVTFMAWLIVKLVETQMLGS